MTRKRKGHDGGKRVGHDGGEGSAWYHIVIAGLTGNLRCPIGVGHDGEEGHDEDINISLSWAEFLVNILYLPKPSNEGKIFEIKDLKRMTKKQEIQLFNDRRIRTIWDDKEEKWYFSVADVVEALTDSPDPSNYWRVLKNRLKKEGNETITICNAFVIAGLTGNLLTGNLVG